MLTKHLIFAMAVITQATFGIKVFSSSGPKDDQAISIPGSSLSSLDDFTLCARFRTTLFSLKDDQQPKQSLIQYNDGSFNSLTILASLSAYEGFLQ